MAFATAPKSGYTQEDLAQLGPSDVERMRKMAEALIASGMGGETISDPWQGIAQLVRGLNGQIGNWQAYRAEQKGKQSASDDFGAATVGFPAAPGGGGGAVAAAGGSSPVAVGNGEIETYIRKAAQARGIDPDTAVKVAMSEGGVKDPVNQSNFVKNGKREESYGPFQLYMGGGLGNDALKAGIDPRDPAQWQKGVDFALDAATKQGWTPWYGAKNVGIGARQGLDQARALGVQQQAVAPDPTQVASLDPSVGVPDAAAGGVPVPQPRPQAGAAPQQEQIAQALIGGGGQDPAQTLGSPALSQQQIMTGQQASQRAAMGNEWLNPGQRRLIESLVGNQIEMGDPRTQLDMELKRAQIEAARQRQAPDPYTLSPGEVRYGADNKEVARGAEKPVNLPAEVEEYNFAKSQGFPGTFMDYQASKKGGMSLSVNPDGTVSFQQGGNIKPLTADQSKDATYATRMEGSLKVLDPYADSLASLPEAVAGNVPMIGNFMKSEAYQKAEQAGREFLAALLRKDSGGAITKDEISEYGGTFLPVPGDKPGTLAQKKASRARALAAIKAGMTPQAIMAQEKAMAEGGGATAAPPTAGKKTIIDGVEIEELP